MEEQLPLRLPLTIQLEGVGDCVSSGADVKFPKC